MWPFCNIYKYTHHLKHINKEIKNLSHLISIAVIIIFSNSLGFCHNKGTYLQRHREFSVKEILIRGKKDMKK